MHYHLEIIMPPTDDVEAQIAQILAPFDENGDDADEDRSPRYVFWDWYKIGGRWGGDKITKSLGADRLAAFYKTLNDHKITVSGLVAGKETLAPAEQAETVNALWREAFPDSPIKECPLFDNYKGATGDVQRLGDTDRALTCSHCIIAAPGWQDKVRAEYMVSDMIWNGVTHVKTTWDGTIGSALNEHAKKLENYKLAARPQRTPTDDWLVVTVDYHT